MKFWTWLDGKKVYIGVIASIVASVLARRGVEVPSWVFDITDGILGLGLAHKFVKTVKPSVVAAAGAVALCLLTGCGSLPNSSGFGTAGAPATAGQLANTIGGSQGQAPATATSGTATVYNNFASAVPAAVVDRILAIAESEHWTADQIVTALKAASGAPTNVTLSGAQSVNSGNASSIPAAGSGGSAGVSGTVGKP